MLQILQDLKNGDTRLADVPVPMVKRGHLLIETRASLISTGTEKMLVNFGKGNLLEKARQQPDKVRMVLDKMRTDGIMPTLNAVRNKLDQPMPLGYCNAGVVLAVGEGVTGWQPGDRVASNGCHAEVVSVPVNLCAHIPDEVPFDQAAFTVLGAIALQGVRLSGATLGDHVAVIGLGLVGLTTVQLLRAAGCRVFGMDFDETRCQMARSFGAEVMNLAEGGDPVSAGMAFSRGRGMDSVLITAATDSNDPVRHAANMSRKRGKLVLVGVAGLELTRADFYEKELTFQVSSSYGPGRYDPNYEDKGQDYPVGFVRWTAQRNFEAVLDMIASGGIDPAVLISQRIKHVDAPKIYADLGAAGSLGLVLEYEPKGDWLDPAARTRKTGDGGAAPGHKAVVGVIGAGNFTKQQIAPNLKAAGAVLHTISSAQGANASHLAGKFGFQQATSDLDAIYGDDGINTVVVTTPHNSHARMVKRAMEAGKAVFVEKPICIRPEELSDLCDTHEAVSQPRVMIGFNRRFSPQVVKMKTLLNSVRVPKSFIMTVNAGALPPGHWTADPEVGGGRIVGEACHFVDLLRFLAGAPITNLIAHCMGGEGESTTEDKMSLSVNFADGSMGTVHYLANGHKSFPKERLEVFAGGAVIQLDNFRKMKGFGWPGFSKMNLPAQDKGHKACMQAFITAVEKGEPMPIPFEEIVEVHRACFTALARAAVNNPLIWESTAPDRRD